MQPAEANPVPDWLSELEAKREKRVKARLGHEAGAGAPCLTCSEKCPGLDLHFWRKICKNCKCSKEDHNVPDDDIYGWAQFQLLGSKPNKIKRKIVLPGNDEVELDWAPKGQPETIDRFLQTLPPESLPVAGSEAAQARKQMLQKQIPIHDLDPALCHDLSESETKTMNDYIDHMKADSVGVGRVIQVEPAPPMMGQMMENLNLNRVRHSGVPKKMTQYGPGKHPMTTEEGESEQFPAYLGQLKTLNYGTESLRRPLPQYLPGRYDVYESEQLPIIGGIPPIGTVMGNVNDTTSGDAAIRSSEATQHGDVDRKDLPCYAPGAYHVYDSEQYPEKIPSGTSLNYPQYGGGRRDPTGEAPRQNKADFDGDVNRNNPQYRGRIVEDCRNAQRAPLNIKDLAFSTYETGGEAGGGRGVAVTNEGVMSGDVMNSNNLKNQASQTIKAGLKALNPHKPALPFDDEHRPSDVRIGAIQDLNYDSDQRIKNATLYQNPDEMPPPPPHQERYGENVTVPATTSRQCHKCGEPFAPNEFAIVVDRASTLYHHRCFTCHGCSQPLADMVYFYDRASDAVYCGRDYAKIRGIPRCSACDELIFVSEYCLAENLTYHLKHFCCFECDTPLAGKDYLIDDGQALCLPCYEHSRAARCNGCGKTIGPTEIGCNLKGLHFHHAPECMACKGCNKPLMDGKMLIKNDRLYCSVVCFQNDQ